MINDFSTDDVLKMQIAKWLRAFTYICEELNTGNYNDDDDDVFSSFVYGLTSDSEFSILMERDFDEMIESFSLYRSTNPKLAESANQLIGILRSLIVDKYRFLFFIQSIKKSDIYLSYIGVESVLKSHIIKWSKALSDLHLIITNDNYEQVKKILYCFIEDVNHGPIFNDKTFTFESYQSYVETVTKNAEALANECAGYRSTHPQLVESCDRLVAITKNTIYDKDVYDIFKLVIECDPIVVLIVAHEIADEHYRIKYENIIKHSQSNEESITDNPTANQSSTTTNPIPVVGQSSSTSKPIPVVGQNSSTSKPIPVVGQSSSASKPTPTVGQSSPTSSPFNTSTPQCVDPTSSQDQLKNIWDQYLRDGFVEVSEDGETLVRWNDNNNNVTNIIIPNSIKTIGTCAFYSKNKIASVVISEGTVTIKKSAFLRCHNLTKVIIPSSITDIECGAFVELPKLSDITLRTDHYVLLDGILYNKEKTVVYCSFDPLIDNNIVLPYGVKTIGSHAFSGTDCYDKAKPNKIVIQSQLNSIYLPDSLENIEGFAFANTNLKEITIPNSVKKIGAGAFYQSSIRSINLPNGLTEIEPDLFRDCRYLKEVEIPHSVLKINATKNREFAAPFRRCKALKQLIITNPNILIDQDSFDECWRLGRIYIPKGAKGLKERLKNSINIIQRIISFLRIIEK